ncbi:hypothetical protein QCE73_38005 [Caballeronia sp. LZ029]|uniref:hypothetical protein n=1 Tax=Caballeronia sp. LZ029 TaxID=3038564 RepID=UPI002854CE01|nr:hypothetical protein [Caballeronia sp. LZ029]MDR5748963.1 hypothetical protein [Caballeronia sp. LZ029]
MATKALRDGTYQATCKARNALAEAMNGHSAVYPQARCTIEKGWAVSVREGKEVWECNAVYAEANFKLERVG